MSKRVVARKHIPVVSMRVGVIATVIPLLVPLIVQLLRHSSGEAKWPGRLPTPGLRGWLRMFRSTRSVGRAMCACMGLDLSGWAERATAFTEPGAGNMEVPLRLEDLQKCGGAAFPEVVPSQEEAMRRLRNEPAALFLATVLIPCVMLYGAEPSRLLRQARQGDLRAFEALLRVDKSIVFDPVLRGQWHNVTRNPRESRAKGLLAAMAGRPHRRFTAASVRVALAKTLKALADRESVTLTSERLRRVFAEMTPTGFLAESEMPGGEVLTKALQRLKKRRSPGRTGQKVDMKS